MYNTSSLPFPSRLSPPGALHHRLCGEADISRSLRKNGETARICMKLAGVTIQGCTSFPTVQTRGGLLKYYVFCHRRKKEVSWFDTNSSPSSRSLHVTPTQPSLPTTPSPITFPPTVGRSVVAVPGFRPDQRAVVCQLQPLDGESPRSLPGSPRSRWVL